MGTRLSCRIPGASHRSPLLWMAALAILSSCGPEKPDAPPTPTKVVAPLPATPLFDQDSAYAFVARQVAFGPRVPGSKAHQQCGDWLVAKLKEYGAEVTEQTGQVTVYTGQKIPLRNIIASWRPEVKDRILLFAHWDTRPFADKDDERRNEPIDGANDGASGVGQLLEIARHLADKQHGPGVDILFTDVEDYGRPSGTMGMDENSVDTWALGAQYFAKNPHVPGYTARFGILLDMTGARDALFYRESLSMQMAPSIVNRIWKTAATMGYGDRFINETKYFVGTDDHVPINRHLRIPSADIIQYDPSTKGFGTHWHTHADNMDVIDKETLGIVGRVVLEVVWQER